MTIMAATNELSITAEVVHAVSRLVTVTPAQTSKVRARRSIRSICLPDQKMRKLLTSVAAE